MYNANHHRLYSETAACDCPAATSGDVPAYTAPGDVTSYRTCYARRRSTGAEHAREAGTVLTLRCVEDADGSGTCECCHVVEAQPPIVDAVDCAAAADRLNATQMDLLRRDVAAASASIV